MTELYRITIKVLTPRFYLGKHSKYCTTEQCHENCKNGQEISVEFRQVVGWLEGSEGQCRAKALSVTKRMFGSRCKYRIVPGSLKRHRKAEAYNAKWAEKQK